MFAEATLTSKGQLTVPKAIRDRLRLKPGDKVVFVVRGDRVEIEVVGGSILDWYGAVKADGPQDLEAARVRVRRAIAEEVVREGATD
jgi:AbrB family looped-hinge helix DNA binding protein